MENILTLNTRTNTGPGPVRLFFRRLGHLFLNPVRFFHEDFPRLDTAGALAFGITNAWLAGIFAFIVSTINSFFVARLFERWVQNLLVSEEGFSFLGLNERAFVFTAGALLLSPFFLLIRAYLSTSVVYLFSRLLIEDENGGPDKVSFAAVLRIQAVALSGRWFRVVPVVGGVVAFLVSMILLITGIRERFAISQRRATAIVLAPYVLLFVAALLLGMVFLLAISQLPAHEFFEMDSNGFGF